MSSELDGHPQPAVGPEIGDTDTPAARAREIHAERIAQLFHQYHGSLVKLLAGQTRSWDEAREIAAQAFEALLAHESPGSVGFLGKYLYRTARNLATDRLRRRIMQRSKEPFVQYDVTRASPSPEPVCVEAERQIVLQEAIANLPPDLRLALIHRIYDDLPDDEIVACFAEKGRQVTARTVRRYIAAAYDQVRDYVLSAESPRRESPS
jgi:RNA polymerase sigma factor (sigma-70 family)